MFVEWDRYLVCVEDKNINFTKNSAFTKMDEENRHFWHVLFRINGTIKE